MLFYHDSVYPEEITGTQLDMLLGLGWYRMGQYLFTTSHLELDEVYQVHWLRFPVDQIREHSSHRKIRKKNRRFRFSIEKMQEIGPEHRELHKKYFASIDFEGASSIEDCLFGLNDTSRNIFNTQCISVYDGTKLIAAGYFDLGQNTAASILHFFDPAYKSVSPGKYLILLTLDYLRQHRFTFYYPGYVVRGKAKMDYKLFLGSESAEYFEPENMSWEPFAPHLLVNTTEHKKLIADQLLRFKNQSV